MANICRVLVFASLITSVLDGLPLRAEVVAIVSAKSPVTSLTETEIAEIFLGKQSHFPDGSKAVPLDLPEDTTTRVGFYQTFAGKSAAQMKAYWSRIIFTGRGQPPAQAKNGEDARKRVAEDPRLVSYVERSLVDASVRIVTDRPGGAGAI